jgi:NAD-dependent dihydropyrimidine dehydrogenase PreA subunit
MQPVSVINNNEYLDIKKRKSLKIISATMLAMSIPLSLMPAGKVEAHPLFVIVIIGILTGAGSTLATHYFIEHVEGPDYNTVDKTRRKVEVWIDNDQCIDCGVCYQVASMGAYLETLLEACPTQAISWKYK